MMWKNAVTIAALIMPMGSAFAASYTVDPAHTYPNFTVSHLGFSMMHGRFGKTEGKVEIDLEKKTGSVQITIDAASINTGHAKRDKHLRSPDFFNAKEFPTITFTSNKVTFKGKEQASIEGELTIVGVTKPAILTVDRIHCGKHPFNKKDVCGFNATTQVKRSDFGIIYGAPAIGDEINIMLEMEAIKD